MNHDRPEQRVVLLDLNYTLVGNSPAKRQGPRRPYREKIGEETYRGWLLDLFADATVHLVTIRRDYYRDVTLERIAEQLEGWQPDAHHFCPRDGMSAPQWKQEVLGAVIFPTYGRGPAAGLLAIESNQETRRMYVRRGVRVCRITPADDAAPWRVLPTGALDWKLDGSVAMF